MCPCTCLAASLHLLFLFFLCFEVLMPILSYNKWPLASHDAACWYWAVVPSTRCSAYNGIRPSLSASSFVAPDSTVVGDVEVGTGSSIWYGAVLRGDVNYIKVGQNSNLQDQVMVHSAKVAGDSSTVIGSNVTVGTFSSHTKNGWSGGAAYRHARMPVNHMLMKHCCNEVACRGGKVSLPRVYK